MDVRPRVLLVDDDEGARRTLSLILRRMDFDVETAATGRQALEKAREGALNLAFIDLRLPDMDGIRLLAPLKELHPDLAAIMVTGHASVGTAVEALNEGASGYVTKPVNIDELLAEAREALEKQRLAEAKRRAEQALREEQDRAQRYLDIAGVMFVALNSEGEVTLINQKGCDILGQSHDEIIGKNWFDTFVPRRTREGVSSVFRQLLAEEAGLAQHFVNPIVSGDGEERMISWHNTVLRDDDGVPFGSLSSGEDVTDQAWVEAERAHSHRLLLALSQAGQAVQRARTPDEVYETVGTEVKRLGFDTTVLALVDEGQKLGVAHTTFEASSLKAAERLAGISVGRFRIPLSPGELLPGVLLGSETVFFDRATELVAQAVPSRLRLLVGRLAALLGLGQTIVAPLAVDERRIGLLVVTGESLTEADVRAVSIFANQAAIAVENARLLEAEQKRRTIAETLRQAATVLSSTLEIHDVLDLILSQLREVIPFDSASIQRLEGDGLGIVGVQGFEDPDSVMGVVFPLDPKFPNYDVVTSKVPLTIKDVVEDRPHFRAEADVYGSERIRSWLGVPLMVKDQVIGMISLDRTEVRPFSAEESELAMAFAHQAAIAMENARLYEEMQSLAGFNEEIVESVSEGITLTDTQGVVTFANPAVAALLGSTPDELAGMHWRDFTPVDQQAVVQAADERRIRGEADRYEVELLRQDGLRVPVLVAGAPRYDDTGAFAGTLAVFTDIAEQKAAEEERTHLLAEIREQAHQLQQVVSAVPEGVLLADARRRVVMLNPAAEDALAVLTGGKWSEGLTHLGGRPIAEFLTTPPQRLWHEASADGRAFELISRPVTEGTGPEGWVLVIRDVTQEREIRAQLRQQERLAAVGQLAGGIAHDFNNFLSTIMLYARIILYHEDLSPKVTSAAETIVAESRRASNLVGQVLDFSRRSAVAAQTVDLASFYGEVCDLLEKTLPESIHLSTETAVEPCLIEADPTRIQQVLMNLAINARDAMPDGGELQIAVSRVAVTPDQEPPVVGMGVGEWVRLTVADTGMGITDEVRARMFEPFFTTKDRGQGTGLGLAQVYGIVRQHHGFIDVETAVGEGTAFQVFLPASRADDAVEEELLVVEAPGQGEMILLVEDHDDLREAGRQILEALGYRVLTATDGRDALEMLEGVLVDLLITDVVMPGMGGKALMRELRERYPDLPVVAVTGYTLEGEMEELRQAGFAGVLSKPLGAATLAQAARRALEAV
ncbi:MAG: response regulator [Anaerolineae bacterium]|jgi:PAS domain S-box-containing protein